jgi:RNA polymerase sigma-70 factor (ECF subfamily)
VDERTGRDRATNMLTLSRAAAIHFRRADHVHWEREPIRWNKSSYGNMIEGKAAEDRGVMAEQSARAADDHLWATFEAQALPHVDRLFRLAMWFERDRSEAEDVVQETMLQALQSFHRFEAGTNCRAWLATILQHVRSNRRRARARSPLVEDPHDRVAEDVLAALKRIPVQFQEVIVLCDVEELTYKEIAETLAIPIGTVMSRLHRGRSLLRSELGPSTRAFSGPRVVK